MKTKEKNKPKPRTSTKWNESFYVVVYQLAVEGLTNREISEALNCPPATLTRWTYDKPGLAFALSEGRKTWEGITKVKNTNLQDFIFQRLPKHLRKLWKKLQEVEKEPNATIRIQRLFEKNGETARKYLFVHALIAANFNKSRALKRLCISKHTFDKWLEEDLHFSELLEEVQFHMQEFVQSKFMELVDEKNPGVVMMAARSLLKDRGFGDESKLKIEGEVSHKGLVDLTRYSMDLQKKILAEERALQAQEQKDLKLIEDMKDV